jgi:uncharacterized RDD family membrane protein YckC
MTLWRGIDSLILASQSRARQKLLTNVGIEFEAIPADIDERMVQQSASLLSCLAISGPTKCRFEEDAMYRIGLLFWIFVVASPVSASASIGTVKTAPDLVFSSETTNIIPVGFDLNQNSPTSLTKEQEEALQKRQQEFNRPYNNVSDGTFDFMAGFIERFLKLPNSVIGYFGYGPSGPTKKYELDTNHSDHDIEYRKSAKEVHDLGGTAGSLLFVIGGLGVVNMILDELNRSTKEPKKELNRSDESGIGATVVPSADKAGSEAVSHSVVAHAPLAIDEIAVRSSLGQLLLRRWLGAWIDFIVLFSFLLVPDYILGSTLYQDTSWIWLSALILYFPVVEGLWGRSLGKLITGTIVVDNTGRPPGILKAGLRTLTRLVEVNPILVGGIPAGIAVAMSKRRQRLGDMLAQTYVVRVKDLRPDGAV